MIIDTNSLVFLANISWIMLSHYVADFLAQTEWMASGKSKSIIPLASHIFVYSIVMLIMMAAILPLKGGFNESQLLMFIGINAVLHFVTDYISSRASSKAYAKKDLRTFWAVIGADQLAHFLGFILSIIIIGYR